MEDAAIREGFAHLRPGTEYMTFSTGQQCAGPVRIGWSVSTAPGFSRSCTTPN